MAGINSGPTPWWQLPEYAGKAPNLEASAPSGYTYDKVRMAYVPIVGSAPDVLAQRDKQQSQQDALRSTLMSMIGSASASASPSAPASMTLPPQVSFSGGSGSATPIYQQLDDVPEVEAPDNSAAQAAIFARAKDKVGLQTAGSLASLRSALAGRGMLGGGGERRGVSNILTAGQAQLGDTTREQAIQDSNRSADFAKMGYEGAISQRGQNITQRGQSIAANDAAASRALSASQSDFSGRIAQRSQDMSAADSAANRSQAASLAATQARNSSVNTLLARLY